MNFGDACDKMKKENKKIKLPEWDNKYLWANEDCIFIYNNGDIYRLKDCTNFRLKNIFRTDWEAI